MAVDKKAGLARGTITRARGRNSAGMVMKPYANGWTHSGKFLKNDLNGGVMFKWAIIFLVVALVAAVLGFSGIAGAATNIAWILAVIGTVLFVIFLFVGRGGSTNRVV